MGRPPTPPAERVLAKTERDGDCLLFLGKTNHAGYGRVTYQDDGKTVEIMAHRAVWEYVNKTTVPEGLFVLHSCDVRNCVEPTHLRAGTAQDNSDDMTGRQRQRKPKNDREFCKNGHAMTPENSYERTTKYGFKMGCRKCQRDGVARFRGYDPEKVGPHNRDKTHCKRGHEFNEENTYINPTSGGRQCKTCLKQRVIEKRETA